MLLTSLLLIVKSSSSSISNYECEFQTTRTSYTNYSPLIFATGALSVREMIKTCLAIRLCLIVSKNLHVRIRHVQDVCISLERKLHIIQLKSHPLCWSMFEI